MSDLSKAIEMIEECAESRPQSTLNAIVEFLLGDTYFTKSYLSSYNKRELIVFAKRLELENE